MKNTILLLFSILLIFSACDKEKIPSCADCNFTCLDQSEPNVYTNDCRDNWECSFKVMSQSKVDLAEPKGVSIGNKNVFQMVRSTEGEEDIADDEFTEILVFELDASQESFSYEASELSLQVHFKRVCFCPEVIFNPIVDGCLQGEKQTDGTWFVQTYFEGEYNFGINAQFEN